MRYICWHQHNVCGKRHFLLSKSWGETKRIVRSKHELHHSWLARRSARVTWIEVQTHDRQERVTGVMLIFVQPTSCHKALSVTSPSKWNAWNGTGWDWFCPELSAGAHFCHGASSQNANRIISNRPTTRIRNVASTQQLPTALCSNVGDVDEKGLLVLVVLVVDEDVNRILARMRDARREAQAYGGLCAGGELQRKQVTTERRQAAMHSSRFHTRPLATGGEFGGNDAPKFLCPDFFLLSI